ncbi:hypothetical protein Droror1_Dr00006082 [Drosera rotundifolia]
MAAATATATATATASFSSSATPRATLLSPLSSFPGRSTHSPLFSPLAKSRVRKLYMAPSAKKSPLDRIPKQFRVENLPDGVKEHYKTAPSFFHGFGLSQAANFMDDSEETILSAGSYLEDQKIGNTVNSSLEASSLGMTAYDRFDTCEISPESPDFRNFALNCRILFLDLPIVSAVAELIASQIVWLRLEDDTKPIHMYINSTGTQNSKGNPIGSEMQAYALAEMMLMFDDVYTVNMSAAFGQAAMLLSIGKKGHRGIFPSARTRFHLPKVPRYSGSVSDIWFQGKLVEENVQRYIELVAQGTGKSKEEVKDILQHPIYLDAEQAIKFGASDSIVTSFEIEAWQEEDLRLLMEAERDKKKPPIDEFDRLIHRWKKMEKPTPPST